MAKKLAFDRVLFTVVVILVGLGLTVVYSASGIGQTRLDRGNLFLFKQSVAALIGLVVMWVAMHIDYRVLRKQPVIWALVGGVAALLLAALLGPKLNDTNRWLRVGGFSLQPSELAKLVLVPFIAYQVWKSEECRREGGDRGFILPSLLVAGLLSILVLLGRDLGSTLLLALVTGTLLFLAGMPWLQLAAGAAALVPAVAAAIWFEPYRLQRLTAFLNPEQDPQGAGFQSLQSLIAIGSGGVLGLGLGKGLQKLHFLPYPHSDFVYAIVGEELGLVGALAVVVLFGLFLWRGMRAGHRAPDTFGKYLAWGLAAVISVQALVHISVSLSMLPATGVTLPFISYGGSSLVVTLAASGILLNVSQHG